jgi:ABC-type sugar transport system permease subunit
LQGRRRSAADPLARRDARTAWLLSLPALLLIAAVALFPLLWAFWEALHLHDLRMPWLGRPLIGLANFAEALGDARFRAALARTAGFAAVSVTAELALGMLLALVLHQRFPGRALARTAALLPWAVPTVVAALIWRFLFEGPASPANRLLLALGLTDAPQVWLAHPLLAWLPILLADIWKSTPFVALLLLAGLQAIDPQLHEAARVDGAGPWQRFRHVTLPLLRPALGVALMFRALDALRVFDLIFVLTGGGPGTATEPLALYAFHTLLRDLRFGYGSALSVLVFALTFALAWLYLRLAGRGLWRQAES